MAAGFIGFFMTLDNIAALFIQLSIGQYNLFMLVSPISLILAAILTFGVKRGEARTS